ncbi:hypothetical protein Tco_0940769 [Tanacetum coccineum]|uniref:Uncharacterized protein n=1 Tax=Tanacetum coccineum TaxID=301880 RepID=A0ABQ5DV10_9ASTR
MPKRAWTKKDHTKFGKIGCCKGTWDGLQADAEDSMTLSDTYAGNYVKEILLNLNLPDHMSVLTELEVHIKMEMEVPGSSKVKIHYHMLILDPQL